LAHAGKLLGRTPLIALSPKKTWEGFIGGAVGTLAAAVPLAWAFSQFRWMYCPRTAFEFGELHCDPPSFIQTETYRPTDLWHVLPTWLVEEIRPPLQVFPAFVRDATSQFSWQCMPVQMHAIVLAAFASIIGPFGALLGWLLLGWLLGCFCAEFLYAR
jgi:phosphatidate cytidylyltransferase